jgi:hypothetical protein
MCPALNHYTVGHKPSFHCRTNNQAESYSAESYSAESYSAKCNFAKSSVAACYCASIECHEHNLASEHTAHQR